MISATKEVSIWADQVIPQTKHNTEQMDGLPFAGPFTRNICCPSSLARLPISFLAHFDIDSADLPRLTPVHASRPSQFSRSHQLKHQRLGPIGDLGPSGYHKKARSKSCEVKCLMSERTRSGIRIMRYKMLPSLIYDLGFSCSRKIDEHV